MTNVPNINQSATINTSGNLLPKQKQIPDKSQLENTPQTKEYTTAIYPDKTIPVYTKTNSEPKLTHTSWFYVNDVHGKMTNMERIYNMTKEQLDEGAKYEVR